MEFNENIVDGLIEISKLKEVLGYKDLRSIQTWCRNKCIRIIVLGKKNYIEKASWDKFLERTFNNSESNLADCSGGLAGKKSQIQPISHSFTKKRDSSSSLDNLVEQYKSQLNG